MTVRVTERRARARRSIRWVGVALCAALTVPVAAGVANATDELATASDTSLTPRTPARLFDSRTNGTTIDGQSQRGGQIAEGGTARVRVAGRAGIPGDASAAMLNVTAVAPAAGGFATVYPCSESRPTASNLNFGPGQTIANAVVASLGSTGEVCIFTTAPTQLIVDASGWFPASGSSLAAMSPERFYDSRSSGGVRQAGSVTEIDIAGRLGIAGNATAAVLNVTAVAPQANGFASVYPCGTDRPNASNLNFVAGQTVPNAVISRIGTGGKVCVFTSAATHLLVDASGSFGPAATDVSTMAPARLLDTRPSRSTVDGQSAGAGVRPAGSVTQVRVAGRGGVDAGAGTGIMNLTVVAPQSNGFASVYPCDQDRPNASNVNFQAGRNVPNAVVVGLSGSGDICIYTSAAAHLLLDASGWFDGTADSGTPGDGGGNGGGNQPDPDTSALTFTQRTIGEDVTNNHAQTMADFNGDGRIDVAAADYGQGHIEVFFQQADGSFSLAFIPEPFIWGPYPIDSADLDGDGDVDIVTGLYGEDEILIYRNNGTGVFTPVYITSNDGAPGAHSVTPFDVDLDGDLDLITTNQGAESTLDTDLENSGSIQWFRNDGNLNFTEEFVGSGFGAKDATGADFDGDGDIDIVSARDYDGTIAWHARQANGTWVQRVIDANVPGAYKVDVADFDADGRPDIVAAIRVTGEFVMYRNTGGGNFQRVVIDGNGVAPRSVWVEDIDRDGDPDVVAGDRGELGIPGFQGTPRRGRVLVFYNNNGNFTRTVLSERMTAPYGVTVGDIDGDGDFDVLAADVSANTVELFENITP